MDFSDQNYSGNDFSEISGLFEDQLSMDVSESDQEIIEEVYQEISRTVQNNANNSQENNIPPKIYEEFFENNNDLSDLMGEINKTPSSVHSVYNELKGIGESFGENSKSLNNGYNEGHAQVCGREKESGEPINASGKIQDNVTQTMEIEENNESNGEEEGEGEEKEEEGGVEREENSVSEGQEFMQSLLKLCDEVEKVQAVYRRLQNNTTNDVNIDLEDQELMQRILQTCDAIEEKEEIIDLKECERVEGEHFRKETRLLLSTDGAGAFSETRRNHVKAYIAEIFKARAREYQQKYNTAFRNSGGSVVVPLDDSRIPDEQVRVLNNGFKYLKIVKFANDGSWRGIFRKKVTSFGIQAADPEEFAEALVELNEYIQLGEFIF